MARIEQRNGDDRQRSSPFALHVVLLGCAAIISFATAIPGEMVWVDRAEIVEAGYRITSLRDLIDVWRMPLDEFLFRDDGNVASEGGYWRPILALELTMHWWLWGDNTVGWHVGNLCWHAGVVIVLYFLGRRWSGSGWVSFFASLLFAVHPLGVHSVAWISGRKDLMCAFFGGLAILAFERLTDQRSSRWTLFVAVLAAVISIGSKELGFCVPIMVGGLVVFRGPWQSPRNQRWALVSMLAVAALIFLYRRWMLGAFGLDADYPAETWLYNVFTAARLNCHYVGRVFFPWQPQISDRWAVTTQLDVTGAVAAVAILAFGLSMLWAWKRRLPVAVPLAWFVVWMLPACGIVPLQHVRAERYLYPATWGLLLAASMAVTNLVASHSSYARFAAALGFLAAAVTCWHASNESRLWRSDRALFTQAVRRDPAYLEGHTALAADALERNEWEACIRHSERGLKLAEDKTQTGFWSPFITRSNYGLALYYSGRHAEAKIQFQAAKDARPQSAKAAYHLGLVELAMGDPAKAEAHFVESLETRSDFLTKSNLAFALMYQNKLGPAQEILERLVAERPEDVKNRRNLASVYFARQEYTLARPMFEQLVEEETQPIDLAKLSYCDAQLGELDAARRSIQRALEQAPQDPVVRQIAKGVAELVRE